MLLSARYMDEEMVTLCEAGQTEVLYEIPKKRYKWTYSQNRNRLENTLTVAGGKAGGRGS